MSALVVGIADCGLSTDRDAHLVTYALGSCLAVAIHDPAAGVAGLLHIMLPDSTIDRSKAERNPWMFADTGIPEMFHRAYALGAQKRRMSVQLAGGANVMDENGVFDIGKRNYLAARKILWKAGVLIQAEAVGGSVSRTVRLEVDSGAFWVREAGRTEQLLQAAATAARSGTCSLTS